MLMTRSAENPGLPALCLYVTGFASSKESHPAAHRALVTAAALKTGELRGVSLGDYPRAAKETGEKHCSFWGWILFILPADVGKFRI